jgi:hypothetical protein
VHTVVNHIPIQAGSDWSEIAARFDRFAAGVRERFPGMKAAQLLKVSDTEAIFVGIYEDAGTMQTVSSEVAAPWFAENIRPFLSGPAVRSVGTMIAGFT